MDKNTRNRLMEQRCRELGIFPTYDRDGRAGYVPSLEDKMLYLDECDDPVTREARACALTEMMGDPDGDDSWTEIW